MVGIKEATANAATLLNEVRKLKDQYLIIHVRHEFPLKDAPVFEQGTGGAEINDAAKDQPNEIVITKSEPNSLVRTDLQKILDDNKITDVIIVGAMTHMCVQGTTRAASEKGYKLTVVKDAVATRDLEFDGVTVPAEQVSATVFATLAFFANAEMITTKEQLSLLN